MTFKKWPSIENHYRSKEISWWLNQYPGLQDEVYILTEKLHGANCQVFVQPNELFQVGTRNHFLSSGDKFYDVWNVLERHQDLIDNFQESANRTGFTYRLFGELFGGKIQKGVKYQTEHKIAFFGLMVDDELVSFSMFCTMMKRSGFEHMLVPIIGKINGLDSALTFDTEFNSKVLDVGDNICEGVVIQPYHTVYQTPQGSFFLLKKKNEAFKEKAHAKKVVVVDSKLQGLNIEFRHYITDNRLLGIFSKYGEIEYPKQIGQYIRYMMDDAKQDFLKDNPDVAEMDKKEQKQIFNVGGTIAKMLKGYL